MLLSKEDVRAAGGIVHSDGNVFFTNLEQLNAAILAKLASAELPEPVGAYESIGSTAFVEGFPVQMLDICDAYSADQLRQAYAQGAAAQLAEKPSAWKWKVNRFHQHLEDYCPPDDAYDEGTLVELYTRRQA